MATVKGTTPPGFGITNEALSMLTQKISVTEKVDKKEAKDGQGDVKAVAYYNNSAEVSIEVIGNAAQTLMAEVVIPAGISVDNAGMFHAEEVTRDYGNEDFVKTAVKGSAHTLIID